MKYELLKELKEPSVIYREDPEDPNNPEVLVKGVGRYRLNTLERNVQEKLEDLARRALSANDYNAWKQVQWMLDHAAMREMVKTIVSAKKEIGGLKESQSFEIDGYQLEQYDDEEEDNVKTWHIAKAPGETKGTPLDHTPYEYLSQDDFGKYVAYHKKHGKWPKHPQHNWDKASLHQMIDGDLNEMFGLPKFKRNSEKEELRRQIQRLTQFIKEREKEIERAREEIESLKRPWGNLDGVANDDEVPGLLRRQAD